MGRYQTGYVYEAFGAFHVRYYATEIVDGKPKGVQESHYLYAKRRSTGWPEGPQLLS
jgi:hypothetical protein